MTQKPRTDNYTWAELLRDLPASAALVISVVLLCTTALVIFYFAEIRTTSTPRTKTACEQAGDVWVPNYANAYGGYGVCQP